LIQPENQAQTKEGSEDEEENAFSDLELKEVKPPNENIQNLKKKVVVRRKSRPSFIDTQHR